MTEEFNPKPKLLVTGTFAKEAEIKISKEILYYLSLNKNDENDLYNITKHRLKCPLIGEKSEKNEVIEKDITLADGLSFLLKWEKEIYDSKEYIEKKNPPVKTTITLEAFKNRLKEFNTKLEKSKQKTPKMDKKI